MKMKKVVAFLSALVIVCSAFSGLTLTASAAVTLTSSYEARTCATFTINAVDSYRFADTLVLFQPGFDALPLIEKGWGTWNDGNARDIYAQGGPGYTSTSPWGTEVIVNQFGIVEKITKSGSGGNAKIPTNGFVLSGNGTGSTTLLNNVQLGDYIRVTTGTTNSFTVYRTTDDSKFTDASAAFKIKKADVLEIVEAGQTPTKSTQWTTTVLVKSTGTGSDGVANHAGYLVDFGGKELDAIPSGHYGIVLSGTPLKDGGADSYNAAYAFYRYAAPGAIVNIGASEIYFRYDVAAAKRAARLISGTTDSTVTMTKDYSAKTIYTDATTKYELVDTDRMATLYNNMTQIADAVQSMTSIETMEPYMATLYQNYAELQELEYEQKAVEMRAVWWRPLENDRVERTAAQLDSLLETNISRFASEGYNMLFVEAFYNSCTIFPTDSSFGYNGLYYKQNPYLLPTSAGGYNSKLTAPYDMLQKTIEICEEYNMECHFWWEVLYVGYERHNVTNSDDFSEFCIGKTIESSIKSSGSSSKYYNWLNIGHDGSYVSGSVDSNLTRYWLNPGNSGVRQFLKNFMSQVCAKYDVGSIQLDYFRHPNDGIREFGYDPATVAAFKAKYTSYKNVDLTQSTYHKNQDWLQFRADYITTLIGEMRTLLNTTYPWMYLTTSPQPDSSSALKSDLQDVQAWLGNGYIDTIFPMAYGYHIPGYVTPALVEQNSARFVCTGLSTDYNRPVLEKAWVRQIRHAGADGVATFGDTLDHYADDIWEEPAVTPTGNASNAAKVYLEEVVNARADKMYATSNTNNKNIKSKTADAVRAIRLYGIQSSEALTAINAIQTLASGLGTNQKAALTADVNYLKKIRNNSRDEAKEDRWLANNSETLTINGTAVAADSNDFVYTKSSNTLLIKSEWATLSGTMPGDLNVVLADGVETVELKNLTMTSDNAFDAIEAAGTVDIELTGTNKLTATTLSSSTITYFGTGNIAQNGTVKRRQGDADLSGAVNSTDILRLMRYNVGEVTLTSNQSAVCDADLSGSINTIDIRMFLDALVGK